MTTSTPLTAIFSDMIMAPFSSTFAPVSGTHTDIRFPFTPPKQTAVCAFYFLLQHGAIKQAFHKHLLLR